MEFKLEHLTEKDMNTILQALSNMPYNQVVELIYKIQNQANETIQQNQGCNANG